MIEDDRRAPRRRRASRARPLRRRSSCQSIAPGVSRPGRPPRRADRAAGADSRSRRPLSRPLVIVYRDETCHGLAARARRGAPASTRPFASALGARRGAGSACPSRSRSGRSEARPRPRAVGVPAQPRNAALIGAGPTGRPMLHARHPRRRGAQGRRCAAAIAHELTTGSRSAARARSRLRSTRRSRSSDLGAVGDRSTAAANTLRLFRRRRRLVRTFHVATGQAIYPTPARACSGSSTSSETRGGTRRPTARGRRG